MSSETKELNEAIEKYVRIATHPVGMKLSKKGEVIPIKRLNTR